MTADPRFRVPLLLATAVVLHLAVLTNLRIAGAAPDLMLLIAVAGGLVGGPVRGAVLGFGSGLVVDLFLRTPMGLSALVFTFVGYGVGVISTGVLSPTWYLPVLTVAAASASGVVLYALVGAMLGEPMVSRRLGVIVAVVAVTNALLALPVIRLVRWALVEDDVPRAMAR